MLHTNDKLHVLCPAGSGELEFNEFCTLAARFLVEEDAEAMQQELKEAFRLYDKEGRRRNARDFPAGRLSFRSFTASSFQETDI